MPGHETYQYAMWRVVPLIERGEFINAGVVLFSRRHKFLKARVHLNVDRLRALAPDLDVATVKEHLRIRELIAEGSLEAGPIASQPQSERFGWLVAPASTVIQSSPVHTGLCSDPAAALKHLFERLVL